MAALPVSVITYIILLLQKGTMFQWMARVCFVGQNISDNRIKGSGWLMIEYVMLHFGFEVSQ
ncbi:hypothetical protein EDC56_3861 [Sinobacterium caligoides]|uniref:Uncharacterized protein n=1 Tax=Sinobacterium caligoides TaxID=933926 RepID=A0A3N2D4Z0_9GAMM|nr:hypothetical protein EDC56_3861 [Sinobacterium caligoides]